MDKQQNMWSKMLNSDPQVVAGKAWQQDAGEAYMAALANKESDSATIQDVRQTNLKM